MVELTIEVMLDIIRTGGILVGIFYYLTIMKNAQKNRMKEMVFQRMQTRIDPEYQRMVRTINPMYSGWNSVEEFYEKYNFDKEPDLTIARMIWIYNLDSWGFLFREGLVGEEYIERLHNPWAVIRAWETFEPLFLDDRERSGNQEHMKDFEYLYDMMKKKYPHLNRDTMISSQIGRANMRNE